MSKKQVLITGITGMLGSQLAKHFYNDYLVNGLAREKSTKYPVLTIDLYDQQSIESLKDKTFDIILHAAANVNLQECEKNPEKAHQIHVGATKTLAQMFPNALFVYISTDSVFDGEIGNYSEGAPTNPLNIYAQSKLGGEYQVMNFCEKHYILRTNIYGTREPMGVSLFEWAYKSLMQEKLIYGYENMLFNPLSVTQLSKLIYKLIDAQISYGIYHVGCFGSLSKYDFLLSVADTFDFDKNLIKPVLYTNQEQEIKRPINTTLNVDLLNSKISLAEYSIAHGLEEIRNNLLE